MLRNSLVMDSSRFSSVEGASLQMAGGGVALVYDERMCAHENLDDLYHPEQPARIISIFKALESAGIVDRCERVEARDATPAELASVHTQEHIANMCTVSGKKLSKSRRAELARRDSIYFNEGSSSSALLAAGSVVEVCLGVARGDYRAGAAVVRPPGHHAEADAAMGFCLFNNVAIAAHVLVHGNVEPDLGVHKVLIVDWDVHHGNGTQHMFWRDPQVLYFSVHRYDFGDFYPGGDGGNCYKIGEGSGAGFNINVPWPQGGFGDLDYLAVFDHVLMPIAQEFKPDLVLVSGGFDSAAGDPLGGCEVTPAGYSQMIKRLMCLANGRLVLALEGGYNLESISDSYLACMKVLLGEKPEILTSKQHHISFTLDLVKEIRRELQPYWSVLSTKDDAESRIDIRETPALEVHPSLSVFALSRILRSKAQRSDSVRNCLFSTSVGPVIVHGVISSGSQPGDDELSNPTISHMNTVAVEEVSAEGNAGSVQETGEVTHLVEAFNRSLSLDEGSKEVTAACLVGKSPMETKDAKEGKKSGIDDGVGGVTSEASSSGSLEVIASHVQESGISNEVSADKISQTAVAGDLSQVNGMDGDADQQRLPKRNVGNDLTNDTPASISSPDHLNARRAYVWYACYASNMLKARFMCYIKGGQVEGMGNVCLGSRNQTPPVASRWVMVPYRLFFGHSWSRTWGSGGVAFLDPVFHGGTPTTHIRLYKITLEQLQDVLTQENGGDPNNSQFLFKWDHVNELRGVQSASSHATVDILKEAWYGSIKYLGDEDGLPMLAITCSVEQMQKFRNGQFQVCPPSESYLAVILRGLLEHGTLSEEESKAYIASKLKGLLEDGIGERVQNP